MGVDEKGGASIDYWLLAFRILVRIEKEKKKGKQGKEIKIRKERK